MAINRHHICPLDLADDLPSMSFGTARISQFTADELEQLFDYPRLARHFPSLPLESKRLAQLHGFEVLDLALLVCDRLGALHWLTLALFVNLIDPPTQSGGPDTQ